jgi:hypothetical protein
MRWRPKDDDEQSLLVTAWAKQLLHLADELSAMAEEVAREAKGGDDARQTHG